MRARRTPRIPTAAKLAVGATVLAFPATALAVTSTQTAPAAAAAAGLTDAHPRSVGYGDKTIVRGSAPGAVIGQPVELEYLAANSAQWRVIDQGHIHAGERYSLSAHLHRSGRLQVRETDLSGDASTEFVDAQVGTAAAAPTPPSSGTDGGASPVSEVTVAPELRLDRVAAQVTAGQRTAVRGRLLPGIAGRRIVLDARQSGRWVPVAATRTGQGGNFRVAFTPASSGPEQVRAAFAGDPTNGRASSTSETVTPVQYAEVSWYDDAGDTACGFHATYGIASRTLPCGTQVTLSYGGRTVVATVDDRGPFVYSRLYDLNQNTAAALGMDGVDTVLASA